MKTEDMAVKFKKDEKVKVAGKIWLEKDGIKFFGPGPYDLLSQIAETGSLHIAASTMGISYRKAWVIVDRLNKVTGVEMVRSHKGGSKGGGSTLSKEAILLMRKYKKVATSFGDFLVEGTNRF